MPKTHITKRYKRIRIEDPKNFEEGSFRIIDPGRKGFTKVVIGCPKGQYDKKEKNVKQELGHNQFYYQEKILEFR